MNTTKYLSATGIFMGLSGILLLMAENIGVETSKIVVPILFLFSGICAILFSNANTQHSKARQYHLIQGIGLSIFAPVIAFIPKNLEMFLYILGFFLLFHGLVELTFGFLTLNSKEVNWNIIRFRFITGVLSLIGVFILLMTTFSNPFQAVTVAGVLIILSGVSIIMFASKVGK